MCKAWGVEQKSERAVAQLECNKRNEEKHHREANVVVAEICGILHIMRVERYHQKGDYLAAKVADGVNPHRFYHLCGATLLLSISDAFCHYV